MLNTRFWQGMPIVMIVLASAIFGHAAERKNGESGLSWDHNLKTAWRAARDQQRPLLLFLTIDGCAHCQKMKQTTLQDKHVQNDLQSHFVPVSLNASEEPEFVKLLQVALISHDGHHRAQWRCRRIHSRLPDAQAAARTSLVDGPPGLARIGRECEPVMGCGGAGMLG